MLLSVASTLQIPNNLPSPRMDLCFHSLLVPDSACYSPALLLANIFPFHPFYHFIFLNLMLPHPIFSGLILPCIINPFKYSLVFHMFFFLLLLLASSGLSCPCSVLSSSVGFCTYLKTSKNFLTILHFFPPLLVEFLSLKSGRG